VTGSSELFDFEPLFCQLQDEGFESWADSLRKQVHAALNVQGHGTLDTWTQAYGELPPPTNHGITIHDGRVTVPPQKGSQSPDEIRERLMKFHPWRKGPFDLFGLPVDTEWRSDWKWDRIVDALELRDRSVLDVGSGNGYYGWRMLAAGAKRVVGLDPFLLYVMQHEVVKRYADQGQQNYVLPIGDDCLPQRPSASLKAFDVTFSMGVLYHRTSPIDHLLSLASTLRPGGQLVLETLVIDSAAQDVLVPRGRYAKMRNVWFIPSIKMLELWLSRTGFRNTRVVDVTKTSVDEQRSTNWMTFESLPDFLDPADHNRTIEGYPAPLRATIAAEV